MIKKSFFGSGKPKLRYSRIDPNSSMALTEIPPPEKISLVINASEGPSDSVHTQVGDVVKTGQKVQPYENGTDYAVAAMTGTISQISQHTGYLGRPYLTLEITAEAEEEEWDEEFTEKGQTATTQTALSFLNQLPGSPNFPSLAVENQPPHTLVVQGNDKDLLVTTNQWFVVNEAGALDQGISLLKKMFNLEKIVLTVPSHLEAGVTCKDAEVKAIGTTYPDGLPKMIMSKTIGRTVPVGVTVEEMGVGFISAEAVVALAKAFDSGRIPVEKTFTVIGKDGTTHLCRARIGTRIKDILAHLNIETGQGDRIVLGGPLTGQSAYTDDMPIRCDTDALLVQAAHSIVMNSDNQCINCGECVRACPARMPVNMLVRVLDNGLYSTAAEDYDLLSCVECGLCSYVCVARIPVFQYVMLGKNEFARLQSLEVSNV